VKWYCAVYGLIHAWNIIRGIVQEMAVATHDSLMIEWHVGVTYRGGLVEKAISETDMRDLYR
jgi:hypothetical protein